MRFKRFCPVQCVNVYPVLVIFDGCGKVSVFSSSGSLSSTQKHTPNQVAIIPDLVSGMCGLYFDRPRIGFGSWFGHLQTLKTAAALFFTRPDNRQTTASNTRRPGRCGGRALSSERGRVVLAGRPGISIAPPSLVCFVVYYFHD